jgi:hypothetical protein
MPEDGKPDNYICEPIERTGKFRIIGIDNDHAFAPPVATEKGHKELKVKCCLFCLDQMRNQIDPGVVSDITKIDALGVVRDWVSRLKKRHQAHARLFMSEEEVRELHTRAHTHAHAHAHAHTHAHAYAHTHACAHTHTHTRTHTHTHTHVLTYCSIASLHPSLIHAGD